MSEETVTAVVEDKPKRKRTKYNSGDAAHFCEVWNTSASAQEVADRLGKPKNLVLAQSATYRNRGIALKVMPRKAPKRLDVDAINKRLAELEAASKQD
jgi:hypothetical protein